METILNKIHKKNTRARACT